MMKNPYYNRGPITKTEQFFGRTSEVNYIFSLLENTQSVSIVGQRRIGKTSLLNYISSPKVIEEHNLDPAHYIFIQIDLEGLNDLSQSEFFRMMLEDTMERLYENDVLAAQIENVIDKESIRFFNVKSIIRKVTQKGYKLIYLFDEFELMTVNDNLDSNFFSGLRNLAGNYDVAYITTSKDNLLNLTFSQETLGSPFFNFFTIMYLNLFERKEAIDLIEEPAKTFGISVSRSAMEFIFYLTGNHPLFLQIACFHMFPYLAYDTLGEDVKEYVFTKYQAETEGHFKYFYNTLNKEEKAVIESIIKNNDNVFHSDPSILNGLERKGLIIRDNDHYRLFSEIFSTFIKGYIEKDRTKKEDEKGYLILDISPLDSDKSRVRIETSRPVHDGFIDVVVKDLRETLVREFINIIDCGISFSEIGRKKPSIEDKIEPIPALIQQQMHKLGKRIQQGYIQDNVKAYLTSALDNATALLVYILAQGGEAKLPWELIYYQNDFLCLKADVVRARKVLNIINRPPIKLKRVLIIASDASCSSAHVHLSEVMNEVETIKEILKPIVKITLLSGKRATRENVLKLLRTNRYQALHFSGHSKFDHSDPFMSSLILHDDEEMTAQELIRIVKRTELQLVYLNSCHSGSAQCGGQEDIQGLADALSRGGVPYVFSMLWKVTDRGSAALASEFYTQVRNGLRPETALRIARKKIGEKYNWKDPTWAAPILYSG